MVHVLPAGCFTQSAAQPKLSAEECDKRGFHTGAVSVKKLRNFDVNFFMAPNGEYKKWFSPKMVPSILDVSSQRRQHFDAVPPM